LNEQDHTGRPLWPLVIVTRGELSSISKDTEPPRVDDDDEEEEVEVVFDEAIESANALFIAIEMNFDRCHSRRVPSTCPERRYSRHVLIAEHVIDDCEDDWPRGVCSVRERLSPPFLLFASSSSIALVEEEEEGGGCVE
jgi:hypothetical protein